MTIWIKGTQPVKTIRDEDVMDHGLKRIVEKEHIKQYSGLGNFAFWPDRRTSHSIGTCQDKMLWEIQVYVREQYTQEEKACNGDVFRLIGFCVDFGVYFWRNI